MSRLMLSVPLRRLVALSLGVVMVLVLPALAAAAGKSDRYTILDSLTGGCSFTFVDISGSGVPVIFSAAGAAPADDDGGAVIELATAFELYGVSYSKVVMSTNGYLAFASELTEEDGGDFSNDGSLPAIPDNAGAPARLMVYHDDLSADASGGTAQHEHFASCPRPSESGQAEACTVLQWTGWGFVGSPDVLDIQAVLYHSSFEVVFQIGAGDTSFGTSTSIGLQDAQARSADVFLANGRGTVMPNTAICFLDAGSPAGGPAGDLAVRITDDREHLQPGDLTTYSIVATNAGPSDLGGAQLSVPQDTAFSSCSWFCTASGGASCRANGNGAIDEAVDLPSGASVAVSMSCQVDSGAGHGSIVTTAQIAPPAGATDPSTGNNLASDTDIVAPSADLSIMIDNGLTAVSAGSELIYTVTVASSGPDTVADATVSTTLPATLVDCGWGCTATAGSSCSASGVGSLSDQVTLVPGGLATYVLGCTVSPTAGGTLEATATVSPPTAVDDPSPADNSSTDADAVQAVADLSIRVDNSEVELVLGQQVTYEIEVTNRGPATAGSAQLQLAADPGLTACSWTCVPDPGAACTSTSSGWPDADYLTLPAGAAVLYSIDCLVSAAVSGLIEVRGSISPLAGVSDPNPANDSASDRDVLLGGVPFFEDGFESGDVTAWSASAP